MPDDDETLDTVGARGLVAARRAPSDLCLVVCTAHGVELVALPAGKPVVLGRGASSGASVHVDDRALSRRHLEIERKQDGTIVVRDLGSRHGTKVSGARIDGAVSVAAGDPIEAGSSTLYVERLRRGDLRVLAQRSKDAARPSAPGSASLPGARVIGDRTVVVSSPAMRDVFELVAKVGKGTIAVLVLGETGSGKEIVAEAIHHASPRAKGPLLKINCAAMNEQLLESELFGHEKGAFTGADRAKKGLFEAAHGGTLFLDEVGELSASLQAKLLRVLEDKKVTPVGAVAPRAVDVRIVSATNRDLEARVAEGSFRSDMLFRLAGVTIQLPPLRARAGEILPIADGFLHQLASELGRSAVSIDDEAKAALVRHSWPGNVRELRNVVERALLLADGDVIGLRELPPAVVASEDDAPPAQRGSLGDELRDVEAQRIREALATTGGNQTAAAKLLGMPRRTLVLRIAQYGITAARTKTR